VPKKLLIATWLIQIKIKIHNYAYSAYYRKEIFMRTTLNIEDKLLDKASKLTGIKEKTLLVRLGLEALIARESSKRLAKLGGTEKKLEMIPRRRPAETSDGSC
jgi:Arc/MetJ family transcription regulator